MSMMGALIIGVTIHRSGSGAWGPGTSLGAALEPSSVCTGGRLSGGGATAQVTSWTRHGRSHGGGGNGTLAGPPPRAQWRMCAVADATAGTVAFPPASDCA